MANSNSWFAVDKDGLAKLLEKRGKAFAIFELVQNSWDTDTESVEIHLDPVPGKPEATLVVNDSHPDGFADLSHAYTLFAESEKKGDPSKRGRFNVGEKLVLALCKTARISSTKGTVLFQSDGHRMKTRHKTERGSTFDAVIRMTRDEYVEVCEQIHRLIPPITTTFNGSPLVHREPVVEFSATLPTIKSDDEGNLTRTTRKTIVRVYGTVNGETPSIYEMGIPVVETEGKYHIDIQQKVPVNLDRDNVPPGYLRTIRALVLNETHDLLDEDEAAETWVTDALSHDDVEVDAVEAVMTQRFGKKRAIYDPSDPEANQRLVAKGYTIIHGGSLGGAAWSNVKRFGVARPSGAISPTPRVFSDDPDAPTASYLDDAELSDSMREVKALAERLASRLLRKTTDVRFCRNGGRQFAAWFSREGLLDSGLTFNVQKLGRRWFDGWRDSAKLPGILALLVHEFAHQYASSHLDEAYHRACTKLAGKLALLALEEPEVIR